MIEVTKNWSGLEKKMSSWIQFLTVGFEVSMRLKSNLFGCSTEAWDIARELINRNPISIAYKKYGQGYRKFQEHQDG
jgi:hypothetical protein